MSVASEAGAQRLRFSYSETNIGLTVCRWRLRFCLINKIILKLNKFYKPHSCRLFRRTRGADPWVLLYSSSFINVRQYYCARYWLGWTSFRPSVRPSVRHTLVLCRNGSTYRQTVFTAWYPHDSSFLRTKRFPEIPMGTPPTGALNARG